MIAIRADRMRSQEYEDARRDLARRLEERVREMDRMYDVAESILTSGQIRVKGFGLSSGTVVVIMLLLTKALKTFRAIRVSTLEGCGQDAAILLRALFETTTAISWILQRTSRLRAKLYAAHADLRTLVMYQEQARTPGLKRIGKKRVKAAQPLIDEWIAMLGKDKVDSVRKHWSGLNSLEAAVRKIRGWLAAYNTVFRGTSSFAHGSDPAQHAMPMKTPDGFPIFKLLPGDDECQRTIAVAITLLYSITSIINKRFDLGLEVSLETVKPQITKRGKNMSAAIYARKSTEENGVADEQRSIARQIEHARAYAMRKGWTVDESGIFVDDGISGAEFANPPGFLRLMNALKRRPPLQVLVMSEESRLGREAIETAYALKQLVTPARRQV